jgi:hypothetical protein
MSVRQGPRLASAVTVSLSLSTLLACEAISDHERTGGSSDAGYFETERRNVVVGAELDVQILDWEYLLFNEPTQVKNATVEPAERATVLDTSGEAVTVRGESEGRATLTFSGLTDDEWQDDEFDIDVVEPKVFDMYGCAGYYVRGERGLVSYAFNPGETYASGEPAYGMGLYPIDVTPTDALVFGAHGRSVAQFAVDISETAPDEIVLQSTLPDDASRTELFVVDRSQVTLTPTFLFRSSRPDSTTTLQLDALATVDGEEHEVCSVLELTVHSLTPASCLPIDPSTGETASTVTVTATEVTVQNLDVRECRVEVRLPDVEGGVVASASVPSGSGSGSGSGGDLDWD